MFELAEPQNNSLDSWIARINSAGTVDEVLDVLYEFRPHNWSDTDRARMSKVYMRRIEQLKDTNVKVKGSAA